METSRRTARLRREYLFRKALEGAERADAEKKRKIAQALAEGKALPTELRREEQGLRREMALEDERTAAPVLDDEYATYEGKPRVVITTSRAPSSRLQKFAKEVRLLFPGSRRENRGGRVLADIVNDARAEGVTDVVLVHEHRGEPDGMIVCHLPHGPTAYFGLSGTVTRHDIRAAQKRDAAAAGGGLDDDDDAETLANVSEAAPHLIFDNFSTELGRRVQSILKHLFPVPKADSKRVITFSNGGDFVSFRHHTYKRGETVASAGGRKRRSNDVSLTEAGPRFEMRLYRIALGTVDETEAETEFVLRPYLNSKKSRRAAL